MKIVICVFVFVTFFNSCEKAQKSTLFYDFSYDDISFVLCIDNQSSSKLPLENFECELLLNLKTALREKHKLYENQIDSIKIISSDLTINSLSNVNFSIIDTVKFLFSKKENNVYSLDKRYAILYKTEIKNNITKILSLDCDYKSYKDLLLTDTIKLSFEGKASSYFSGKHDMFLNFLIRVYAKPFKIT